MVLRGASTASGPLEALCGENPEPRTKNQMNLSGLLPLIQATPGLAPVLARLRGPEPDGAPLVLGLPDAAKAATLAALAQGLAVPLLVLAARPDRARALVPGADAHLRSGPQADARGSRRILAEVP